MKQYSHSEIEKKLNSNSESADSNVSIDILVQNFSISSLGTDLGSEYSHESIEDIHVLNDNEADSEVNLSSLDTSDFETSREQMMHTLLEHYKTMKLFGIKFTWLGIHKLYRTILVAGNTYINEPLTRVYFISIMLLIIAGLNAIVKPYKSSTANNVAILSYVANIFIAMVNIGKGYMMTFASMTNQSFKIIVLTNLDICENVLLIYLPITAASSWIINQGIKKCTGKVKHK